MNEMLKILKMFAFEEKKQRKNGSSCMTCTQGSVMERISRICCQAPMAGTIQKAKATGMKEEEKRRVKDEDASYYTLDDYPPSFTPKHSMTTLKTTFSPTSFSQPPELAFLILAVGVCQHSSSEQLCLDESPTDTFIDQPIRREEIHEKRGAGQDLEEEEKGRETSSGRKDR